MALQFTVHTWRHADAQIMLQNLQTRYPDTQTHAVVHYIKVGCGNRKNYQIRSSVQTVGANPGRVTGHPIKTVATVNIFCYLQKI